MRCEVLSLNRFTGFLLLTLGPMVLSQIWEYLELRIYGEVQARVVDDIMFLLWIAFAVCAYALGNIHGTKTLFAEKQKNQKNEGENVMATYDREVYRKFRSKDILLHGFDEITILLQYLYMSEEHFVVADNGLCKLEIRMNPAMQLTAKNLNFPDVPASTRDIVLPELLGIIEQLEEAPAVEFPQRFQNRWEEIKTICAGNLVNNRMR